MVWRFLATTAIAVLAGCAAQIEDVRRTTDDPQILRKPSGSVIFERPSLVDRHPPEVAMTALVPPVTIDPLEVLPDEDVANTHTPKSRTSPGVELEPVLEPVPEPEVPVATAPAPPCPSPEVMEGLIEEGSWFAKDLKKAHGCNVNKKRD